MFHVAALSNHLSFSMRILSFALWRKQCWGGCVWCLPVPSAVVTQSTQKSHSYLVAPGAASIPLTAKLPLLCLQFIRNQPCLKYLELKEWSLRFVTELLQCHCAWLLFCWASCHLGWEIRGGAVTCWMGSSYSWSLSPGMRSWLRSRDVKIQFNENSWGKIFCTKTS